eukprot:Selendium_serpulae@DN3983_c0_g1_i2.p1
MCSVKVCSVLLASPRLLISVFSAFSSLVIVSLMSCERGWKLSVARPAGYLENLAILIFAVLRILCNIFFQSRDSLVNSRDSGSRKLFFLLVSLRQIAHTFEILRAIDTSYMQGSFKDLLKDGNKKGYRKFSPPENCHFVLVFTARVLNELVSACKI